MPIASIFDNNEVDLSDLQTYQLLYLYAKKYQQSVGLFSEDGRLSIKNSRDIDQVISLLRSRYYTSDLTG